MNDAAFRSGVERLRENGFNLLAVFDCDDLPEPVRLAITRAGIEPARYQRLVLLGNSGGRLWDVLKRAVGAVSSVESDHPVDQFSILNVEQTVADYWGAAAIEILYPGHAGVALQQLGRVAGWHHDSPLGIGIHHVHGLWFAYRAAFLIDAPLPLEREPDTPSPCASCKTQTCVGACPAHALRFSAPVDMNSCISFALADDSPCRAACLAREACPVGAQDRYTREQITYHYGRAVSNIKRYRGIK